MDIYDSRDLGAPLVTTVVEMSKPEVIENSGRYLVRPGYASIGDLVAAYPQLAGVPSYTIRVQASQTIIDPPRTLSAWAFVTVTNNDTQEVTIVSP